MAVQRPLLTPSRARGGVRPIDVVRSASVFVCKRIERESTAGDGVAVAAVYR